MASKGRVIFKYMPKSGFKLGCIFKHCYCAPMLRDYMHQKHLTL